MTVCFKFAEPKNRSVIELDPEMGDIYTSVSGAEVSYRILDSGGTDDPAVNLKIIEQAFTAQDIEELIAFLECVRLRLRGA